VPIVLKCGELQTLGTLLACTGIALLSLYIQINIYLIYMLKSWPGSSVGIATGYGLDGPGSNHGGGGGGDFAQTSRPARGPPPPPVPGVPGHYRG
jgi:hypothetical protein